MSSEHTVDSHGRVPYEKLSPDERQALHDWCALHDIDHTLVPIDTSIERDDDEWVLVVHRLNENGHAFTDPVTRDVAVETIRRPYKAELPWRRP